MINIKYYILDISYKIKKVLFKKFNNKKNAYDFSTIMNSNNNGDSFKKHIITNDFNYYKNKYTGFNFEEYLVDSYGLKLYGCEKFNLR